jgi:hypothetical protein
MFNVSVNAFPQASFPVKVTVPTAEKDGITALIFNALLSHGRIAVVSDAIKGEAAAAFKVKVPAKSALYKSTKPIGVPLVPPTAVMTLDTAS